MAQYLSIHPENPQTRLLKRAIEIVQQQGVMIYPTDSCYAMGAQLGDSKAVERIRRLRQLDDKHNFTLVCRDLSEIANYAKISNTSYRLLKGMTPGPYTFILKATHCVPCRTRNKRKKTIGIRIPEHNVTQGLLDELGGPIISTTLILPGEDMPMIDPDEIREHFEHHVDVVVDAGATLEQVIRASGILEQFPGINLAQNKVGVFGKLGKLTDTLHPGDRVEIYRPLIADPKVVRKKRAAEGKAMKKGAGNTK